MKTYTHWHTPCLSIITLPSPQRCKYLLHLILMQVYIKQEPRGPHRSPGKQFQSINTFAQSYDNTIMLIKKEKYTYTFSPLQVRILCVKFDWTWPSAYGGEDFKISCMFYILLFRYFLPFGHALHFYCIQWKYPSFNFWEMQHALVGQKVQENRLIYWILQGASKWGRSTEHSSQIFYVSYKYIILQILYNTLQS